MAASRFVEVTDEEINCFIEIFQIITYVIILKQLFISGSLNKDIHHAIGK